MELSRNNMIIIGVVIVLLLAVGLFFWFRPTTSNFQPPPAQEAQPSRPPQLHEKVDPNQPTLILFWMNGCGPCNMIKPNWVQAYQQLAGAGKIKSAQQPEVPLAMVDCEASDPSSKSFNVPGYPTVRLYSQGLSQKETFIEYSGDRSAESLMRFAESMGQQM